MNDETLTSSASMAEWYRKNKKLSYHQMDWDSLKALAAKEKISYRQIAKDLKISRNTIRKYLSQDVKPARRPRPIRDEWRDRVKEIWTYHSTLEDKPRATAKWICSMLVEKHGYSGSERTIRTLIVELKENDEIS